MLITAHILIDIVSPEYNKNNLFDRIILTTPSHQQVGTFLDKQNLAKKWNENVLCRTGEVGANEPLSTTEPDSKQ